MKTSVATLLAIAVFLSCVACDDAFGTIPTPTPVPTKTPAELDMDIVISFLETSQADRSRLLGCVDISFQPYESADKV